MKHWNFCGTNQMRMPYAQLGSAPRRTGCTTIFMGSRWIKHNFQVAASDVLIYYNQYKYLQNIVILYIYISYITHIIYILYIYIYLYL